MDEKRRREIERKTQEVRQELSSLTPLERIIRTVGNLPRGEPAKIVMNEEFFAEWFYYCQEHNADFKEVGTIQVVLDKTQPFKIGIILKK